MVTEGIFYHVNCLNIILEATAAEEVVVAVDGDDV